MKIHFWGLVLLTILFSSCSPLHHLNKFQSDNNFKKSESKNFAGEKAKTQWWYFDCFFEDGSVLVFLFNPYEWWNTSQETSNSALFYISHMDTKGKVTSVKKVFDNKDFFFDGATLRTPYFELTKTHPKNAREYKVKFDTEKIKGTATIQSASKGFSPFPTGSMGTLATRYILKKKGDDLAFRYAAHIPQGKVECDLEILGKKQESKKGKAYHEQGWFTGDPHELGKGWTWFHFVSENINIFGKPYDFIYLQKEGKRVAGGVFYNDYLLSNQVFSGTNTDLLISSNLSFTSKNCTFKITPLAKPPTTLIYMPAFATRQVWGNVLQPSSITITINGKEQTEEGYLILETCIMGKDSVPNAPVQVGMVEKTF